MQVSVTSLRGGVEKDRGGARVDAVVENTAESQDDGALLVAEILREDPVQERGEREEWTSHVGWHRKEDVHVTSTPNGQQKIPLKSSGRVVAVGDVHGDKGAFVRALRLAKLVSDGDDKHASWIGGTDLLVQIGDLVNARDPRDREVLEYVKNLEQQARAAGGGVIVILGDHDLQNAPALWHDMWQNDPFPSWMCAVWDIHRTLFVHGSLSSNALDAGGGDLDEMNLAVEAWLAGDGRKPGWLGQDDGPIWSRLYSDKASDTTPNCYALQVLLDGLSLDRMVIGHTVRREGISSLCDGRVWRIDVGLSRTESRAGKIGASEVLEVSESGQIMVKVLSTEVKLKTWK